MSDEIRVGDRFLVEVEVTEVGASYAGCLPAGGLSSECFSLAAGRLHASKRLPRALKVGDRVRLDGRHDRTGVVLATDDDEAWIKGDGGGRSTWYVSDLTLSEEPTP